MPMRPTKRQLAFVEGYMLHGDRLRAYREAGYSMRGNQATTYKECTRLVNSPLVQGEIEARLQQRRKESNVLMNKADQQLENIMFDENIPLAERRQWQEMFYKRNGGFITKSEVAVSGGINVNIITDGRMLPVQPVLEAGNGG